MINVGIIGAGFMGATHARVYSRLPNVRLRNVASREKKKAAALAAEVSGCAACEAGAILKDPLIDVVDVTTPTALHGRFSIRALQNGKHVIVEKPLALTLAEADDIIATSRRAGKLLMVGHVLRFLPKYITMRELLLSGRLGQPYFAVAHRLSSLPDWANWFRDARRSGGAVLDLHIHDLDILNWFFGAPSLVEGRGARDRTGGWNHVLTLLDYGSLSAVAEASWMMPAGAPFMAGLRILCEHGVLEYVYRSNTPLSNGEEPLTFVCLHEKDRASEVIPVESGDMYERQLAYFIQCVETAAAPTVVPVEEARLALAVALAARQSLETQGPVRM